MGTPGLITLFASFLVIFLNTSIALADIPTHCLFPQIQGKWTFYLGHDDNNKTVNCTGFTKASAVRKYGVSLHFPDKAVDDSGNEGFWTMVHDQGFEVIIGGRSYFAFNIYKENTTSSYLSKRSYISYCGETFPGWSHNEDGTNWACYIAYKDTPVPPTFRTVLEHDRTRPTDVKATLKLVEKINSVQRLWIASNYTDTPRVDTDRLMEHTLARRTFPPTSPVSPDVAKLAASLPENLDWRSVNGVDYITPVRNQGSCGSCYAFACTGMNEARVRIMTNNTRQPVFSPQDIVECSEYSQGCEGGYEYLLGGKYAEDFGVVEEHCNPYKANDSSKCNTDPKCSRTYFNKYEYVGGFYGACNADLMKIDLVKYGPMTVAYKIHSDFFKYKAGIYYHTGLGDKFDPFQETSHASLLVGYGTDKTDPYNPIDYWIVKNSWGSEWGENGYFRIRRGVNECAIESTATQAQPIL